MSKRRATKPASSTRREQQEIYRLRLFEALGIIEVSRHALASKLTTLDEDSVIDALKAAYRLIEGVAGSLATEDRSNSPE